MCGSEAVVKPITWDGWVDLAYALGWACLGIVVEPVVERNMDAKSLAPERPVFGALSAYL